MNTAGLLKAGLELVVSAGVSSIVTAAVKTYIPVDAGTVKKIVMVVGGYALSSMVAHKTSEYVNETVTSGYEAIFNTQTKTEND